MKTQIQPEEFIPRCPSDFIGGARQVGLILKGKAKRMKLGKGDNRARVLIYGQPGVGKTRLAEFFARELTDHAVQIESVNGRVVSLELVKRWQHESKFLCAFGKFTVKIVNELDTCPPASQDLLLTYLDEMPPNTVFIGTSNLEIKQLVERFQTRLQQFKVGAPHTEEINALLHKWKLGKEFVKEIAVGCGGNVRAALLDAQSVLDANAA